jgi:hypothetical protein
MLFFISGFLGGSLSEARAAVRTGHIWSLSTRVTPPSRHLPAGGRARNGSQAAEVTAMSDEAKLDRTYAGVRFAAQPGERWRKFLERVGTHSNDFASRLSRARFVYLHRRENGSHWLPL